MHNLSSKNDKANGLAAASFILTAGTITYAYPAIETINDYKNHKYEKELKKKENKEAEKEASANN